MERKDIASVLKVKRIEAGLSVKEVAELLDRQGVSVSDKTIYGWESGHRQPDSDTFLILCGLYGINSFDEFTVGDTGLSVDERRLLDRYSQLSVNARGIVMETILRLIGYESAMSEIKQPAEPSVTREMIPVYQSRIAAGIPLPIVTDHYDEISKDATVPKEADFGLVLSGDSMEPAYPDGCTVWVQSQPTVENGEIGVFIIHGEATCKKFYLQDGVCRLLSLNEKYTPIEITEEIDMTVAGKVIGYN